MDFFNITLPFGKRCPYRLASPLKCTLNVERTRLRLNFNQPNISRAVHVLHADAFRIMARTESQTCTIAYNGPETVIFSERENCVNPYHTDYTSRSDLLLIPNKGCPKDYHST